MSGSVLTWTAAFETRSCQWETGLLDGLRVATPAKAANERRAARRAAGPGRWRLEGLSTELEAVTLMAAQAARKLGRLLLSPAPLPLIAVKAPAGSAALKTRNGHWQ
jgi:hypothetical protein